jgi:hypothetical protein
LLLVPAISALGSALAVSIVFSFRVGKLLQKMETVVGENATEHITLDRKVREVDKRTTRAHERLDAHAVDLAILKRDNVNLGDALRTAMGEVNANLRDLRKEIMDVLKERA